MPLQVHDVQVILNENSEQLLFVQMEHFTQSRATMNSNVTPFYVMFFFSCIAIIIFVDVFPLIILSQYIFILFFLALRVPPVIYFAA